MSGQVHATFGSPSALERARTDAAAAGAVVQEVHRPVPPHEHRSSPVRAWVLGGGVLGFLSGWGLTVGTALAWPLRVGGKPIVSWPAFFIIAFELTILFAALAGFVGFLRAGRLPSTVAPGYRGEAGVDRFELRLRCAAADAERIRAAVESAGGEIVEVEG